MFTKSFANYVCPRDSIIGEFEGFELIARVEYDEDTRVTDFDCYDESAVSAWKRDDWFFCGIIVKARRHGVTLGSASLWGIDANFPDSDNSYLTETAVELASEAIAEAKATILKLCQAA